MSELTTLSLDDYDAIAAAVEETERGRWFLAEYARRNRTADTEKVLEAIAAIERRIAAPEAGTARLIGQALAAARKAPGLSPGDLGKIEDLLGRALGAVDGAADPDRRPNNATSPVERPRLGFSAPKPEDDVTWIDLEDFAEEISSSDAAAVPPEAPSATQEPPPTEPQAAPHPAEVVEAPRFVSSRPASDMVAPARPKLPSAHTPLLLDGLSDADKAILFA